jgi:hypothetical protein
MAHRTVHTQCLSIRLAREAFTISQTYFFQYVAKRRDKNARIAQWSLWLRATHQTWALGYGVLPSTVSTVRRRSEILSHESTRVHARAETV